jgi:hypothetical protein
VEVDCRHRWVIETPNGPTVAGACKRCGEVRTFPAAGERDLFNQQRDVESVEVARDRLAAEGRLTVLRYGAGVEGE